MPEFDSTIVYRSAPSLPEEFYRVGSDGSLWSRQKRGRGAGKAGPWRRVKDHIKGRGYRKFRVAVNGVIQEPYVHQLVLETFIGPCPPGMQACHNNGDRTDNRAANLRWDTPAANQADRIIHGTDCRGEKHYRAKVTEEEVREMRRLAQQGATPTELARRFGISDATIGSIVRWQTWRHVL